MGLSGLTGPNSETSANPFDSYQRAVLGLSTAMVVTWINPLLGEVVVTYSFAEMAMTASFNALGANKGTAAKVATEVATAVVSLFAAYGASIRRSKALGAAIPLTNPLIHPLVVGLVICRTAIILLASSLEDSEDSL